MKSVFAGVLLLAACGAGCGETPIATSPTRSLFSQELGGLWQGDLRLATVRGGECVGADIVAGVGEGDRRDFEGGKVTVTQDGDEVTALVRSEATGLSCTYSGAAGVSLVTLNSVSCDEKKLFFQCANGETRQLDLVGSTMNAFARVGATANGTVSTFYNVSDRQDDPVAGLTLQYDFSAVRP
jgi:hypothetical protein